MVIKQDSKANTVQTSATSAENLKTCFTQHCPPLFYFTNNNNMTAIVIYEPAYY